MEVTSEADGVRPSLLGDTDPTIARYALGLVRDPGREQYVMRCAEECSHASEAMFKEELMLLKRLASR